MSNYNRWLFIFRQDLRIDDNSALFMAFSHCKEVLPVFIFDEEVLSRFSRPDRRIGFLVEVLADLQEQLRAGWSDLLVLHGKSTELIPELLRAYRCDGCFWNRSYGVGAEHRDVMVRERCAANGVACHTSQDYLLVEPQQVPARKVFTPFYHLWQQEKKQLMRALSAPFCPLPNLEHNEVFVNVLLDLSRKEQMLVRLQGAEQNYWSSADGRRKLMLLPLENYTDERNRPDKAGTSQLSPYLRFGVVSVREILDRVVTTTTPWTHRQDETVAMDKKVFANSFVSELAWREFWWHIHHYFPESRKTAFQEKRRTIARQHNETWLTARKEWRTGYPIVDAGMRQLQTMNWMHGRVRMIVASFLCKDLLIDRQEGERHFANLLLDYDEAVNMGNRQRSASVGADPKPLRIFNPILQSQKFDPDAIYIKTRLQELAHHTPEQLHDPLLHKLDRHAPIVNHYAMSKQARALYKGEVLQTWFFA